MELLKERLLDIFVDPQKVSSFHVQDLHTIYIKTDEGDLKETLLKHSFRSAEPIPDNAVLHVGKQILFNNGAGEYQRAQVREDYPKMTKLFLVDEGSIKKAEKGNLCWYPTRVPDIPPLAFAVSLGHHQSENTEAKKAILR